MKDAKGHGSNGRGGGMTPVQSENAPFKSRLSPAAGHSYLAANDPRGAHSTGVQNIPANMTRQHFVMIANMLKDQAGSTDRATHQANVARYADKLATTNPRFDRARFTKAAGG